MNFSLSNLPERSKKPRQTGLTMVMDKGISIREAEDFVSSSSPYVDIIKLGFGTSYATPNLKEKLKVYKAASIPYYFGGTLFEAFIYRNQFEDYVDLIDKFELELVEVSDGCLEIEHQLKCEYINKLTQKGVKVLSEVGSKDETKILAPYQWIELINKEIDAGSWKVIAEARESGNIGIYRASGEVRMGLVNEVLHEIDGAKLIWEAPKKQQQAWFIELSGANVNLGNIAINDVIPLETLRLGLRGDTFFNFYKK